MRGIFSRVAGLSACVLVTACSGNLGSGGSGMTLPQAPQSVAGPGTVAQGAAGGAGAPAVQSRQRVLEGTASLEPGSFDVALPSLDGFSVALRLATPAPTSSGPLPSASPAATTSGRPTAAPSAAPSATVSAVAAGSRAALAAPSPGTSDALKLVTKTTIFPDAAPPAPTASPTAGAQSSVKRTALVRGYFVPARDVVPSGLSTIRFTIPKDQQTDGRGFTVALFEAGKKHDTLLGFDAQAALASDVVASTVVGGAVAFKKGTGYFVVLYGDELPATPEPVVSGYPTPGNNPFGAPAGPVSPGPFATPSPPSSPGTQQPH